jgi:hypothetical protein
LQLRTAASRDYLDFRYADIGDDAEHIPIQVRCTCQIIVEDAPPHLDPREAHYSI